MAYNSVYNVVNLIKNSDGILFSELAEQADISIPQLYKILELIQYINPNIKYKKGKGNVKFIYLEK